MTKDVQQVAKYLGCKSESVEDIYETLISAPVKDLYDNCEKNLTPSERFHRLRKWRIIFEEESEDAFITKSAVEWIIEQNGQINVPLLTGTNNGDGMPRVAYNLKNLKELNDDMVRMIPKYFQVPSKNHQRESLARAIKQFYFGDQDLSEDNLPQLSNLLTDHFFLTFHTISSEFFARYQPRCKQFLYEFQFDGRLNIQKKLVKLERMKGACHADDVFYLFGGELADKVHVEEGSRESKMRQMMCKLWANFAKYHDPTPDHDNPLKFKWPPVKAARGAKEINLDYLVINDEMKMVRNLNKDRMDFWRNAYKTFSKDVMIQAKL